MLLGNLFAGSWFETVRQGACQVPRCGTGGIHRHYGTCQDRYGSARDKILGPTKRDFANDCAQSKRNLFQWTPGSVDPMVLDLRRHFSALSANDILGVGLFSPVPLVETKTVCLCWCQLDRAFNRNGRFVFWALWNLWTAVSIQFGWVGSVIRWSDNRYMATFGHLFFLDSWKLRSSSFRCTHANLSYLRCECGGFHICTQLPLATSTCTAGTHQENVCHVIH